ncbi:MAG: hypothetical protein ACNS64_13280 [Candidatus Halalkalibacterium sp. M3_1C_030]
MPGLKYILLTCSCFILYSFISDNVENEPDEIYARGNITDNFSIEELLSSNSKTLKRVSSEELQIHSDWTFKKGAGITPAGSEERYYSPSFSVSDARFVCWELIVEHKPATVDRDLNFKYSLFGVNNNKIADATADSWIPAGSDLTEHSACWGSAYPGSWKKGDYHYKIRYESEEIGKAAGLERKVNFTIY